MESIVIDQHVQSDFQQMVISFSEELEPDHRYASFDYCYNYFYSTPSCKLVEEMEKSCMVLGFYLASWGMLRGSSFLLSKSARHFSPVIEYVSKLDRSVWEIDVDCYSNENMKLILTIYSDIRKLLMNEKKSHKVLVSKILLGIFGFIPAYDRFFCYALKNAFNNECAFQSVGKKSLLYIKRFYEANSKEIDSLAGRFYTMDFDTGQLTDIRYKKAKIVDMYGFSKGKATIPEKN